METLNMSSNASNNGTLLTSFANLLGDDSGHFYDACKLPVKTHCDDLITMKEWILSVAIMLNVITLLMVFLLKKYQFFSQRVFAHIVLSNTLYNIFTMWVDGRTDKYGNVPPLCIAQAFFSQIIGLVMFFWIFSLTIYLYQKVIRGRDTSSYERWYVGVCWLVPIVIAFLPLTTGNYGLAAAPYCWINDTKPMGQIWRFAAYYVPVSVGVFVVFITFVYMHWKASVNAGRFQGSDKPQAIRFREMVRDNLKPLTAYAGSYVILLLPQIANRIQHAVSDTPIYELVATTLVCMTSYGIVLPIVFVITNGKNEFTKEKFRKGFAEHRYHVRQAWRHFKLSGFAGCCGRRDDEPPLVPVIYEDEDEIIPESVTHLDDEIIP